MLPPKRFDENPNTATQVKKNGTEKFGMDQDGVAKKISAEDLLKIENIENGAKASVLAGHVDDKANPHAVTKAQVGLGNVTNLAPADLPLSDAEIGALALKADKATTYTKTEVDVTIDALSGRLDTLEGTGAGSVAKAIDDALEPIDARVDSVELTIARHDQDLASVKQTLQQGNVSTLDFEDIGIVLLDARATGRANPTVDGLTATNLISFIGASRVINGITFTNNGDGSITANGTATTDAKFNIFGDMNVGAYHTVFLAGCPAGGSSLTYSLIDDLWIGYEDTGSGAVMGLASVGVTRVYFVVRDGVTVTNLVAKPRLINLTSIYGSGNEPSASDCAKIFSYFDGTKSIQLPARVRSVSEDETETSTLYIADDSELRSIQTVYDTVSVVNGEHMLTKKISTRVSVASGVAVNTTNYPTSKTGGKFAVELTAGGTQIGVIGTDSTSGAGMLRYELATPVITELLTSGILQAKPKGTVYFEPYYEGAHQTDASLQITLPYTGTIDKLTGYDENLEPYEIPSTGYTLVGTLLTITGAEENEVYYVELSRSEPLAPEMEVNVLNNDQVTLDSVNGKYYKITFTTANGVPTTVATEVV